MPGQILPSDIAGELTTVNGAKVTVTGSGDNIKVNDATDFAAGTDTENRTPPDTGVGASGTCLTAQATSQLMPTTLARIRITLRIVRRVPKHQE